MTEAESSRSRRELNLCQTCLVDEIFKDAIGYCLDCVEGLCDNCIKYHRRSKASREHDVLRIVDDNSKCQLFQCLSEILRCKEHPDLYVERYCDDHKRYVCSVCLSTTHRSCQQVTKGSNKSFDFTLVETISDDIEQEVAIFRQKRQANECQIRNTCDHIAHKRKILVEQLRGQIDELDKKLESETELLLQSEIDNLCMDLNYFDEIEERQKALMNIIASHKKGGLTKKSHVIGHEMEHMLRAMKESILKRKLTQIVFVETDYDLVSLGKVKKVTYSDVELSSTCADSVDRNEIAASKTVESNSTDAQTDDHKEREQQRQLVPLFEGNCTWFRNISIGKEKVIASVTAIVLLQNGWFVVADKANKMLKVFTDIDKYAYKVACLDSPLSMCMLRGQDVAVIFSDTNRIQRYRIDASTGCRTGQFFSGRKCRDIASYNNDIALLVHGGIHFEIEIRQVLSGQVLKYINVFTGKSEIELRYPSCFMYLQPQAVFIVGGKGKVQCLNEAGKELWLYKQYQRESELDTIIGLAADDEDNLYLCCQGSENVHQVFAKNCQNRVILSYMKDIKTIAFDTSNNILYVGFAGCDEISCYRFV